MGCFRINYPTNFSSPILKKSGGVFCFGVRKYRYHFNGQERDDEIAGEGNINTAVYWEYDTRLGRRWNLDPVVKPWESGYASLNNTPQAKCDPKGDNPIGALIGAIAGTVKEITTQTISNGIKNVAEGKGFFKDWGKNMDWADVGISAGEGALAGATMGMSLLATTAVSSSLKGSVDYKYDDKSDKFSFKLVGVNKSWSKAIKETSENLIGSFIGFKLGSEGLSKGLLREAFKGIRNNWIRSAIRPLAAVVQGTFEGVWQYGTVKSGNEIYNRYLQWYYSTHPIELPGFIIKGKTKDERRKEMERKIKYIEIPQINSSDFED